MHGSHPTATLAADLAQFPAVALLGPRQCGKTTLAQRLVRERGALYLDLERPSDRAKVQDAEGFLRRHQGRLVCLDEVQRVPGLFEVLRSLVDEDRRPGRFLLLGSASPGLLRQSSESLAGRLALLELTPFQWGEVVGVMGITAAQLWLRGGFPQSLVAEGESASRDGASTSCARFSSRTSPSSVSASRQRRCTGRGRCAPTCMDSR